MCGRGVVGAKRRFVVSCKKKYHAWLGLGNGGVSWWVVWARQWWVAGVVAKRNDAETECGDAVCGDVVRHCIIFM